MCASIGNEAAARRYVAELVRGGHWTWARQAVESFQRSARWLLDYDRVTCERAPPPRPKSNAGRGMRKIREALREVLRTPPPTKIKATV